MPSQWYYLQGGQQNGPISTTQLKEIVSSGQLKSTDLLWKEGMSEWAAAWRIKGLFSVLPPPRIPASIPSWIDAKIETKLNETLEPVTPSLEDATASAGLEDLVNAAHHTSQVSSARELPSAGRRVSNPWSMVIGLSTVVACLALVGIMIGVFRKTDAGKDESTGIPKVQADNRFGGAVQVEVGVPQKAPQLAPAQNAGEELLKAIIVEAAQREQQQQAEQQQSYKRSLEQMTAPGDCQACGGTGRYRYVDESGHLVLKDCPYCHGQGGTRVRW